MLLPPQTVGLRLHDISPVRLLANPEAQKIEF